MLPTLTKHLLGTHSTIIIALTMGFSCLATATALNNLYADFLRDALKLKTEFFPWILGATSAVSFALSLLDFQGISAFLQPILAVIYPGLIGYTLASLISPKPHALKQITFYGITIAMIVFKFFI